jgi:hypothetical protein
MYFTAMFYSERLKLQRHIVLYKMYNCHMKTKRHTPKCLLEFWKHKSYFNNPYFFFKKANNSSVTYNLGALCKKMLPWNNKK